MDVNLTRDKIEKSLESFETNINSVRAGRAHASLVENIAVEIYGSPTPISHIASIQTPSSDQIIIQAWDPSSVAPIEKALRLSELGLNPSVEGNAVRIIISPLTNERREEFVKIVRRQAEEARISFRNIRESGMEEIDKALKDKIISEDDKFKKREEVQKIIEDANKKIQDVLKNKEYDIMND